MTVLMPLKNGVLLLDKSALQGLSLAETKVLYPRAMLYQNIPPILLHEIRGDLAKVHAKGRDAATVVTGLASKVNGVGAAINVDHREICTANLLGLGVDMDSAAIMPFGASGGGLDAAGRRTGVVIDQLPLDDMLRRWRQGKFTPDEQVLATTWRKTTKSFSQDMLLKRLNDHRIILPKPTDVADLYRLADDLLARVALQETWLEYLIAEVGLRPDGAAAVRARWTQQPQFLSRFAPYAHFCMRVILAVTAASRHRLIRWEPTTVLDANYLYYVPFCRFFASGDHVHINLAPPLLTDNQRFLTAPELKRELRPLLPPTATAPSR